MKTLLIISEVPMTTEEHLMSYMIKHKNYVTFGQFNTIIAECTERGWHKGKAFAEKEKSKLVNMFSMFMNYNRMLELLELDYLKSNEFYEYNLQNLSENIEYLHTIYQSILEAGKL